MSVNRIKALEAGLIALLVLALVAGRSLDAPLQAEGPAKPDKPKEKPDEKSKKPDEKPKKAAPKSFLFGTVKEVSADGKTVTVAPGPFTKDKADRVLKLGDKTVVRFNAVGPGEAQVRKGQSVTATLGEKGSDAPERAQFAGTAAGKAQQAFVAGVVSGVGEDGKSLTIAQPAKGKGEKPKEVTVKLTARTMLLFNNVGPGEAKAAKGMNAVAMMARRAKDTAAQVYLTGASKASARKGRWAHRGQVVAVGADGKSVSVQVPALKKDDKAVKVELKLGPASQQVFNQVGPGGAKAQVGYRVSAWVDDKDKDTVTLVYYQGAPQFRQNWVYGRVTAVAGDGKSFTLRTQPAKKGEEGKEVQVKLAGDATVLFNNVPPGGARITAGYQASARMEEDAKDTAELAIFFASEVSSPKPRSSTPTP